MRGVSITPGQSSSCASISLGSPCTPPGWERFLVLIDPYFVSPQCSDINAVGGKSFKLLLPRTSEAYHGLERVLQTWPCLLWGVLNSSRLVESISQTWLSLNDTPKDSPVRGLVRINFRTYIIGHNTGG